MNASRLAAGRPAPFLPARRFPGKGGKRRLEQARELIGKGNPTVKRAGNGTIQGFYLNGVAYLVRDGIARGNVMGVLMHEYGEHAAQLGFRSNVGYRAILESLKRRQNENSETGKAIQAAMERARNAGVNERDPHFWSEVAAYIVEANANVKTSALDRVTNFFKKWLFKTTGLGADNFTHKYLVMFAKAAVRAGRSVNEKGQVGTRGEDAARLAMYPARESSLKDFMQRVKKEGPNADKSYYPFTVQGKLEGIQFRFPSDIVFHQVNDHPDMTGTDNSRLGAVLNSLDSTNCVRMGRGQFGETFVGMARVSGVTYGVSFSKADNGFVYINTFFKVAQKV